jgi:hypothetical protein
MNQNAASRGPNVGLLLLIPAAVILAKAAMHRRAMFESGWAASEADRRAFGQHGRFGGRGRDSDLSGFRLPPKIERVLEAWHTRAHATPEAKTPDDLAGPDDAVTV